MVPEGALPPQPRVEGVRERHDRARDVALDDRSDIGRVQDRRVFDNQWKIVIDERIVEGVQVYEDSEQGCAAGW